MPAPAQDPPKLKLPATSVQVSGNQDHHQEAGFALAAALGWSGEPYQVTASSAALKRAESEFPDQEALLAAGVRVDDAQNFLVKVLHEAFQAGALAAQAPTVAAVAAHFELSDRAELGLVADALALAYSSGKGAQVSTISAQTAVLGASLIYDGNKSKSGKVG